MCFLYDPTYVRGKVFRVDQEGVLDNVKVIDEFDLLEQRSGRRAGVALHCTFDQVERELVVLVLGQAARVHKEQHFARRPNEPNVLLLIGEQLLQLFGQGEWRVERERTVGLDRTGEQIGRRLAACQARELIRRIGRLDASYINSKR